MLRRRILRAAARLALAGLLFAQAAFAIAGCTLDASSAARAVVHANAAGSEPCHDAGVSHFGATLCTVHCVTNSHSLDRSSHPLPLMAGPAAAGLFALLPRAEPLALREAPPPVSGPPARILFRTLRV